jgi:hypothetical protein
MPMFRRFRGTIRRRGGHKAQDSGYTELPFARHPHKKERGSHRLPAEEEIECPRYQKPRLHIIFSKRFACISSYLIPEVRCGIKFWVVVHYTIEKPVFDCSYISFLAMCNLYVR